MKEAMFACIDIYKPEYILSKDLGLLNYATTPTNPMQSDAEPNVDAPHPNDVFL